MEGKMLLLRIKLKWRWLGVGALVLTIKVDAKDIIGVSSSNTSHRSPWPSPRLPEKKA